MPNDERHFQQLLHQATQLRLHGQYQPAMRLAAQARELGRQLYGEHHPNYATCLGDLGLVHKLLGKYEQSKPLYEQAAEIYRTTVGEDHPYYATSLNNLAELHRARGQFAEAEPLCRQAMEIDRKALGEHDPDYAIDVSNLAALHADRGQYALAEPLCHQALQIVRSALGENHLECARTLNNLGQLYGSMKRHREAEPLFQQALQIVELNLGRSSPAYAATLGNLAVCFQATRNHRQASALLRQSTDLLGAVLGESHPDFADSLDRLAHQCLDMGEYAEAELTARQAMTIRSQVFGNEHPVLADSLSTLVELFAALGDYAKAEFLAQEALKILRATLGEKHPKYAACLSQLGMVYQTVGKFEAAEPLVVQVMAITRAAHGEEHPSFAAAVGNAALLYKSLGKYAAAAPLYLQASEIAAKVLGPDDPSTAHQWNNLARFHETMGDFATAEPHYQQALKIRRAILPERHPDLSVSLNNLAILQAATDRPSEALALMEEAMEIDHQGIQDVFSFSSESQRMAFLRKAQGNLHAYLSLVGEHFRESPAVARRALDLVLRRKAIGAEVLMLQRDTILGGKKHPAQEALLRELAGLRMQIAGMSLAEPGAAGLAGHRQRLAALHVQKARLEDDLAHQIREIHLEQRLRDTDCGAVALGLPEGLALVEFVLVLVRNFKGVAAQQEPRWKQPRYFAFTLHATGSDEVRMIDLGEAEPIGRMIADFRSGVTGEAESRAGRDLGAAPSDISRFAASGEGQALRAAVFDKLIPALAGCKRLLLAPDGDLARLPFEALPTADGRRLIDEYAISYLSCGRDVLRFGAKSSGPPAAPLVLADPDFDLATGTPATPHHPANDLSESKSPLRKAGFWSRWFGRSAPVPVPAAEPIAQPPSPAVAPAPQPPSSRHSHSLDRGLRFGRLKGTRLEGERIAALLGVTPWLDVDALESRLKACRSPRILHLATHGFFLADQKRDPNKEFRDLGALPGQASGGSGRLSGAGLENPLLRSGLALAGANTWLKNGALPAEAEDGLLTAEDVTGLDLLDTDLVVLSACETGLGQIQVGEGVFGLRRAFVLAGAKTLVMSLWKVPDQQTQELMEDFYRSLLNGKPRAEALREAQLALKARRPEPLYWGAFICQGDPAPLPRRATP